MAAVIVVLFTLLALALSIVLRGFAHALRSWSPFTWLMVYLGVVVLANLA